MSQKTTILDLTRKDNTKSSQIIRDFVSPYKEMISWLNSFTISYIRRDANSSLSSSLPMESILALIDNLAPEKVERNIRDKAGPFFNKGNEVGVLLTHGFCSTAQEMKELGEIINKQLGYTTLAVLLAGHGTSPGDLAQTDMIDWYKSLKEGYDFLKQFCTKIVLLGHSLGGTLSLILAANEPVDAIVTFCAPIKVEYFMQDYLFLISDLLKYFPRRKEEIAVMEENSLINYRVSALKAVEHLLDTMEIAKEEIKKVTAPILTITAGKDARVPIYNAEKIHKLVSSEIKEDYFSANSPHTLLYGSEKMQIIDKSLQFMKAIVKGT